LTSIDQIFNNQYYKKSSWIYLLIPLSIILNLINILKYYLYEKKVLKKIKVKVPVIIIGNITLGGTGKTPLALNLIGQFLDIGLKPGLISRGYGGKATNTSEVFKFSDVKHVGDEALLIKTKNKIPVFVGKDRVSAAESLLSKYPETSLIICDDGLQHIKLDRDFEILVIDAQRKFGNGFLFPAGPLRESKARLDKVDAVVVKGKKQNSNHYQMNYSANELINLKTLSKGSFSQIKKKKIIAITAIGNPDSFFSLLAKKKLDFKKVIFDDHYIFKENDFINYQDYNIIMTEKDAIKCKNFANKNFWQLPIRTTVDDGLFQDILEKVM